MGSAIAPTANTSDFRTKTAEDTALALKANTVDCSSETDADASLALKTNIFVKLLQGAWLQLI